jgi:hypothetical protein
MTQTMFASIFAADLAGPHGKNWSTAFVRSFLSLYEDIDNQLHCLTVKNQSGWQSSTCWGSFVYPSTFFDMNL